MANKTFTYTLPCWAALFSDVQKAMLTHAHRVEPYRLVIDFDEREDLAVNDALEFGKLLTSAKLPHDVRTLADLSQGPVDHRGMHRYTLVGDRGIEEFVHSSAKWRSGDDDLLSVQNLYQILVHEQDPETVLERIRSTGLTCGMNLQALKEIGQPQDDVLFAMAFLANDRDLLEKVSTPDMVNQPLRGTAFKSCALFEAVRDENVEMVSLLLRLGARSDAPTTAFANKTVHTYSLLDDNGVSPAIQDMIASAAARQAAMEAISSLSLKSKHTVLAG